MKTLSAISASFGNHAASAIDRANGIAFGEFVQKSSAQSRRLASGIRSRSNSGLTPAPLWPQT
jgi:hypothetical protein